MTVSIPKEHIYKVIENNQSKIISSVLIIGGLYLTYKLGKKFIIDFNKTDTQFKVETSSEVRQAMALRSAMNPSGISWMMSMDTTNTDSVMETAQSITSLEKVSKSYKNLYQDNLLDDLQSELSTTEYQKFLAIIMSNAKKNTTSENATNIQFAKPNQMVVAKKEVFIRSSPDASNHGSFYEAFSKNNIIRKAKQGEFLGYSTGYQHFDEVNNVKFIEVSFAVKAEYAPQAYKNKDKSLYSYWITSSSNYVELFPYFKTMWNAYPKTMSYSNWMKPPNYFTLKGIHMPYILTKTKTPILNHNYVVINIAEPNIILGQLIMSLNTGKEEFLQFITADKSIRWVDKKFIKLEEIS